MVISNPGGASVTITATDVVNALFADFTSGGTGNVRQLLESKLLAFLSATGPWRAVSAVLGRVRALIALANFSKAFYDLTRSRPFEEFSFSITLADAIGITPSVATAEDVEAGTVTAVIRGRGFNTDVQSYIQNTELGLAPNVPIRACESEVPPQTLEAFRSVASGGGALGGGGGVVTAWRTSTTWGGATTSPSRRSPVPTPRPTPTSWRRSRRSPARACRAAPRRCRAR